MLSHCLQKKLQKTFSESLIKQSHALFKNPQFNPVKAINYDKERIQKICETNKFDSLTSSEKEYLLTQNLIEQSKHNAEFSKRMISQTKIDFNNASENVTFTRGFDLIKKTFDSSTDYKSPISQKLQTLKKQIEDSIFPNLQNSIITNFNSEQEIVQKVFDFEQSIENSTKSLNLNEKEIVCLNLSLGFNFFNFKKWIKRITSAKIEYIITRDLIGHPSQVKMTFTNENFLQDFIEKSFLKKFEQENLLFLTKKDENCESFHNRTIIINELPNDTTENEVLSCVSKFGRVQNLIFPSEIASNKKKYTSDIINLIQKNKHSIDQDLRIVINEFDGQKIHSFVAFEPKIDGKEERLLIDNFNIEEDDFNNILKTTKKKNIEKINDIISQGKTVYLDTLHDSLKIDSKVDSIEHKNQLSTEKIINYLSKEKEEINEKNLSKFLTVENKRKKSHLRLMGIDNSGIGITTKSIGVCFITFSSVFEAKKAIYGLKFNSHFNKTNIDLLSSSHLHEHIGFINDLIYEKIHLNNLQRNEIIQKSIKQDDKLDIYDPDVNVKDINTEKLKSQIEVTNTDFNINRVLEKEYKENIKTKEKVKEEIQNFLNTFVEKEQFNQKSVLTSKLVDLGEVESVLEKKGRQFMDTPINERINLLKEQLEISKDRFNQRSADQNQKLIQNLENLSKNHKKEDIRDSLEKIAHEYGLKNDEIDKFKTLLEEKPTILSQKRFIDGDSEIVQPERVIPVKTTRVNRVELFNSLGKQLTNKYFSEKNKKVKNEQNDSSNAYFKLYSKLEAKYTGEFFESDQFADYIVENFLLKKEK